MKDALEVTTSSEVILLANLFDLFIITIYGAKVALNFSTLY